MAPVMVGQKNRGQERPVTLPSVYFLQGTPFPPRSHLPLPAALGISTGSFPLKVPQAPQAHFWDPSFEGGVP